jgi:hypothetical protein
MENAAFDPAKKLAMQLDALSDTWINEKKGRLANLERFDTKALDWLMLEHYQFSARNPAFLQSSAETTRRFRNPAISKELVRNFNEEKSHAKLYAAALRQVGIEIDSHVDFTPTATFFDEIETLINGSPSTALGTMYATETAAIFEHQVFRQISEECARRHGVPWDKLRAFHDMHLSGVEQGHKDELGVFLTHRPPPPTPSPHGVLAESFKRLQELVNEGGDELDKPQAFAGGIRAIEAMIVWWEALLAHVDEMSGSEARTA